MSINASIKMFDVEDCHLFKKIVRKIYENSENFLYADTQSTKGELFLCNILCHKNIVHVNLKEGFPYDHTNYVIRFANRLYRLSYWEQYSCDRICAMCGQWFKKEVIFFESGCGPNCERCNLNEIKWVYNRKNEGVCLGRKNDNSPPIKCFIHIDCFNEFHNKVIDTGKLKFNEIYHKLFLFCSTIEKNNIVFDLIINIGIIYINLFI